MKRLLTLVAAVLLGSPMFAQNFDNIKNLMVLQQMEKAKAELDKSMSNAKFAGKAEAWILKSTIYSSLAMSPENKANPEGDKLAGEAFDAFSKYREMEPDLKLAKDPFYQNGPVNLYSAYYSSGYNDYAAKRWQAGLDKLKRAVEMSDLLIKMEVLKMAVDTNLMILAGVTAEKVDMGEAVKYYTRLADLKLVGPDYESVYQTLVRFYYSKRDMANFNKYKSLGNSLFPKSEFFTLDNVDFAVGLATNFAEKVASVEEVLASEPNNFRAHQILGEIIYDTLTKEGAEWPANGDELEKKMANAFNNASKAQPNNEMPLLYLGDYYYFTKADKTKEARNAHAKDMQARTKPGTKASAEDIAKRDKLDLQLVGNYDQALEAYLKIADILSARAKHDNGLELKEKEQYKKVINNLSEIYGFKKVMAKNKPADQTKFAAEEKKWNDLYDTINALPTLKRGHDKVEN